LDDIRATRRKQVSRRAESGSRKRVLEAIRRRWCEPLTGATARTEIALDDCANRRVGNRRIARIGGLRSSRVRVADQRQRAAGIKNVVDSFCDRFAVSPVELLAERYERECSQLKRGNILGARLHPANIRDSCCCGTPRSLGQHLGIGI